MFIRKHFRNEKDRLRVKYKVPEHIQALLDCGDGKSWFPNPDRPGVFDLVVGKEEPGRKEAADDSSSNAGNGEKPSDHDKQAERDKQSDDHNQSDGGKQSDGDKQGKIDRRDGNDAKKADHDKKITGPNTDKPPYKFKDISRSSPNKLTRGDVVSISFLITSTVRNTDWNTHLIPLEFVRVGTVSEGLVGSGDYNRLTTVDWSIRAPLPLEDEDDKSGANRTRQTTIIY